MNTLKFDLSKNGGTFKPLNAVNGGPYKGINIDQIEDFKEMRIPFIRNHDVSFFACFGGDHTVDITAIFPNFDADPYDSKSYDFPVTDHYMLRNAETGAQTFYRLGQKIDHRVKKYDSIPPKDPKKWAVICEHIIRHYNEEWADGFQLGIQYWEIWNEPDLDLCEKRPEMASNKRTWAGTKEQFFELYETAAKHLKKCFPELKIGGPSLAWSEEFAEEFLLYMQEHNVEIDFFSWHLYRSNPILMAEKSERIKGLMVKAGYGAAESILNEWNYLKDWHDNYVYSIRMNAKAKGAAYVMACMSVAQKSSIDMLIYYLVGPNSAFNGVFEFRHSDDNKLKTYYALKMYGMFYDMKAEIRCENEPEDIYSLCGCDNDGKVLCVLTYFTNEENMPAKDLCVDFGKESMYEIYLLDEEHNAELINTTSNLKFTINPNTCVMIKEV